MAWITAVKYGSIAVLIILGLYKIYAAGVEHERAKWESDWIEFQVTAEKEKAVRQAEIDRERKAYNENLQRVINDKQKTQAELNQRIHDLRASGLWISSKACPGSNSMPGKTKSSSSSDSSTGTYGKIRLPEQTEKGLLGITHDAQELVDKYNSLRDICLPLVDIN